MKKKLIFLIIFFIIYTVIVNFCPVITQWDRSIIVWVQDLFGKFPSSIPYHAGSWLYSSLITIPIIVGIIYFFRKLLLIDLILFASAPAVAYILNKVIIKNIVQRPRPPIDMQLVTHKASFSYVSNHTIVTCTLWGLVIYYLLKYCENKHLKIIGVAFGIFWILFEGFSRIWLGVHNPTDVLGSYILAGILLFIYINLIKLIGGKC